MVRSKVRRLPIRLEPYAGESWYGYTQRVAATYGVTWPDLMQPILCADGSTQRPQVDFVDTGTSATQDTLSVFARHFNLDTNEVQAMHLSAYLERITPNFDHSRFDPVEARRPWEVGRCPPGKTGLYHPFVTGPRSNRHCPICTAQRPQYRALIWRFGWYAACLDHGVLLSEDGGIGQPRGAPPEVLEAERTLLNLLGDEHEATIRFNHFERWLATVLKARRAVEPGHLPSQVAEILPTAVRTAIQGTAPDQFGLAIKAWGLDCAVEHALRLLTPSMAVFDRPVTWFPTLLPVHIYVLALSDLLYPLDIQVGRMLIARFIQVASDVTTWDDGLPRALQVGLGRCFLRTLTNVQDDGRMDQLMRAIVHAARTLRREDVDYSARAQSPNQLQATVTLLKQSHPARSRKALTGWVVRDWACSVDLDSWKLGGHGWALRNPEELELTMRRIELAA